MDNNPLNEVLTVSEVATLWHWSKETVFMAIGTRKNPLQARKSCGTWLISRASCVKRWGEPPESIRDKG
jgi:hypothetical protein